MISQYYQVFDMSQLEDYGYLQVGIGQINDVDLIGKDAIAQKEIDEEKNGAWLLLVLIFIILGILCCVCLFVKYRNNINDLRFKDSDSRDELASGPNENFEEEIGLANENSNNSSDTNYGLYVWKPQD